MKSFHLHINKIVKQLHKSIDSYNRMESAARNEFKLIVKASFIKQLETLNSLVTDNSDKSKFLFIPLLRGSCEDLIALKYIKQTFGRKVNKLVRLQVTLGVNKSLTLQKLFFSKYRRNQQILTDEHIESIEKIRDEFEVLLKLKGINGNKLPSTETMSREIDLNDFYEFIFRGTSDFVHFNNGILARMAWSSKLKGTHISMNNFNDYYTDFSYFYTSYVFTIFCEHFKNEIGLTQPDWALIKKIKEIILTESFWPELVTFEEMNIPRPQQITRMLTESFLRLHRGQ